MPMCESATEELLTDMNKKLPKLITRLIKSFKAHPYIAQKEIIISDLINGLPAQCKTGPHTTYHLS